MSLISMLTKRNCSFLQNGKFTDFTASFPVSVLRQNVQFPTDVIEALMLNMKESAHNYNLECFVEVCSLSIYVKSSKNRNIIFA